MKYLRINLIIGLVLVIAYGLGYWLFFQRNWIDSLSSKRHSSTTTERDIRNQLAQAIESAYTPVFRYQSRAHLKHSVPAMVGEWRGAYDSTLTIRQDCTARLSYVSPGDAHVTHVDGKLCPAHSGPYLFVAFLTATSLPSLTAEHHAPSPTHPVETLDLVQTYVIHGSPPLGASTHHRHHPRLEYRFYRQK